MRQKMRYLNSDRSTLRIFRRFTKCRLWLVWRFDSVCAIYNQKTEVGQNRCFCRFKFDLLLSATIFGIFFAEFDFISLYKFPSDFATILQWKIGAQNEIFILHFLSNSYANFIWNQSCVKQKFVIK